MEHDEEHELPSNDRVAAVAAVAAVAGAAHSVSPPDAAHPHRPAFHHSSASALQLSAQGLMDAAHHPRSLWVFGYGSLCFKVGFPFRQKVAGYVQGYGRRFWQGSTDHRGVPEAPGRVVTLFQSPSERAYGVAYEVSPEDIAKTLEYLDYREKGGYTTEFLTFHPRDTSIAPFSVMVYIGNETNPSFLGPDTIESMARQILSSKGPSGDNLEYFERLYETMAMIGDEFVDSHLRELKAEIDRLKRACS